MLTSILMLSGLALHAQPGSLPGIQLWLRADSAATQTGGTLTGWTDLSGNNTFTVAGTPNWQANLINFNPAVVFTNPNSGVATARLDGDTEITLVEAIGVFRYDTTFGTVLGSTVAGTTSGDAVFYRIGNENIIADGNGNGSLFNNPFQSTFSLNQVDLTPTTDPFLTARVNGRMAKVSALTATSTDFSSITFTPVIGGTAQGTGSTNFAPFQGELAELLVFDTPLSEEDRQKTFSYLAIKYGITLDTSFGSYLASDGTVIWNNKAYTQDIFGIGRDDAYGLNQTSGNSINSGSGDGTGQPEKANIVVSSPTTLTDLSFLLIGHDGGSLNDVGNLPADKLNLCESRVRRLWKVEETGTVGAVDLSIDLNGLNFTGDRALAFYKSNANNTVRWTQPIVNRTGAVITNLTVEYDLESSWVRFDSTGRYREAVVRWYIDPDGNGPEPLREVNVSPVVNNSMVPDGLALQWYTDAEMDRYDLSRRALRFSVPVNIPVRDTFFIAIGDNKGANRQNMNVGIDNYRLISDNEGDNVVVLDQNDFDNNLGSWTARNQDFENATASTDWGGIFNEYWSYGPTGDPGDIADNYVLIIDPDGDGIFEPGAYQEISPNSLNNRVLSYPGVDLPDGAVFTLLLKDGGRIADITIDTAVCGSFRAPDGQELFESGRIINRLSNAAANGCDSVVTYNVAVFESTFGSIVESICEPQYLSPSGKIFDQSGIYEDTISNATGCDSILTIDLTFLLPSTASLTETACGSYSAPSGKELFTTGIFQDTIPNAAGCDSILTIDLTIVDSIGIVLDEIACASYTSPSGKVFTSSGMYLDTVPGPACDSFFTIDLTLEDSIFLTIEEIACASYTSPSGKVFTSSGIFQDTLIGEVCDSFLTIDLTIEDEVFINLEKTACASYTSPSGKVFTSSGTYLDTVLGQVCDSFFTIDLQISPFPDTDLVQAGNALIAQAGDESSYQWLDCGNNFAPIAGANEIIYLPEDGGEYAVEVTSPDGCVDTSSCFLFTITNVLENQFGTGISIFPNPTSGQLTLDFDQAIPDALLTVRNATGQIMLVDRIQNVQRQELNLEGAPGLYFIELIDPDGNRAALRVMKK